MSHTLANAPQIETYQDATAYLGDRVSRALVNNTMLVRLTPHEIGVRLHDTIIIQYHADGRTTLRTGGWLTTTTKASLNQFSPAQVNQTRHAWYVRFGGDVVKFYDGMTLEPVA